MKTFTANDTSCSVNFEFDVAPGLVITIDNHLVKKYIFSCPLQVMDLYHEIDAKRMGFFLKQVMRYNIGVKYDLICYCLN